MSDGTYSLLLAFDSDNADFARGVEVGRLWAAAHDEGIGAFEETIHSANAEMGLRIAEATDRKARSWDDDGHWLTICFSAIGEDFAVTSEDDE